MTVSDPQGPYCRLACSPTDLSQLCVTTPLHVPALQSTLAATHYPYVGCCVDQASELARKRASNHPPPDPSPESFLGKNENSNTVRLFAAQLEPLGRCANTRRSSEIASLPESMMYHQRKTETKTIGSSLRAPGARLNTANQSRAELLQVPNSSRSRPSKNVNVPRLATGVPSSKVSFATKDPPSVVKPETRKPSTTTTVRTTVTTFTTKPRIKPEKHSPPLFNVTNYNSSTGIDPSIVKKVTQSSNALSRPSRAPVAVGSSTSSAKSQSSTSLKPQVSSSRVKSITTPRAQKFLNQTSQPRARQQSHKEMPIPILKKTAAMTLRDIEDRPIPPECVRCDICKRGFLPDRLEKHRDACRKMESRPKKVFNATVMRTAGTELESYIKRGAHQRDVPVKKSNWRAKHEEFLSNVREAKKVQDHLARGGKLSDLPPPRRSENPDYVQCPHCSRKFNESAAERHIPKCANILSNKKKTVTTAKNKR